MGIAVSTAHGKTSSDSSETGTAILYHMSRSTQYVNSKQSHKVDYKNQG